MTKWLRVHRGSGFISLGTVRKAEQRKPLDPATRRVFDDFIAELKDCDVPVRIHRALDRGIELLNAGRYSEANDLLELGLALSRRFALDTLQPRFLVNLAATYRNLGQSEAATRAVQEALDIARRLGDATYEARALGALARIAHEAGRYDEAVTTYSAAILAGRAAGDYRSVGVSFLNLGYLNLSMKLLEEGEVATKLALEAGERCGDPSVIACATGNIGFVHLFRGHPEAAEPYMHEQLAMARASGDRRTEAMGIQNLLQVWEAMGKYQEALETLEANLDLLLETKVAILPDLLSQMKSWRAKSKARRPHGRRRP